MLLAEIEVAAVSVIEPTACRESAPLGAAIVPPSVIELSACKVSRLAELQATWLPAASVMLPSPPLPLAVSSTTLPVASWLLRVAVAIHEAPAGAPARSPM